MGRITRHSPPEIRTSFVGLNGTLTHEGNAVPVDASVSLGADGNLLVEGRGAVPDAQFDLVLTSLDGWTVTCTDCVRRSWSTGGHFELYTLHVIAEYGGPPDPASSSSFAILVGGDKPFAGEEFDDHGRRSAIVLKELGRDGIIYGLAPNKFENEIGYMWLRSQGQSVEQDVKDVALASNLLSFAYARFISAPWYARFDDDGRTRVELRSPEPSGSAHSRLYVTYPGVVSELFRGGWRGWQHAAGSLNLLQLLQQYILGLDQRFLEASIMLLVVWMEAFKHQYASSVAGYQRDNSGYFLDNNGTRLHFRQLVEEGMRHFGITTPFLGFVPTRNEVIHTGSLSLPVPDRIKMKQDLEEAIEEFFFSILDYHYLRWDRTADTWVKRP